MISNFLRLPVTREIMAGPKSTNISGTLGGTETYFHSLVFSEGDKPIDPIVENCCRKLILELRGLIEMEREA